MSVTPFDVESPKELFGDQQQEELALHNLMGQLTPQLQLEYLDRRMTMLECTHRKHSADLLFVGSLSGLIGFLFAFIIGTLKSHSEKYDYNFEPFKSGRGYFPSTVSEMVHDPTEPAGKAFFCFEFVASILIFFSFYPTRLRNAYIGDDAKIPVVGVSWTTFRQLVPATGMMILSVVTTVPAAQATTLDYFCIGIHGFGAMMMFVGYFFAEAFTVGWGPFAGPGIGKLHDIPVNVRRRRICLTGILVFYLLFLLLQGVLAVGLPGIPASDYDQWGKVKGYRVPQLLDSAEWSVKILKMMSYGSEVLCGVFLIASHLCIWNGCEERHYDLDEELHHNSAHRSAMSTELEMAIAMCRGRGSYIA